jgi:hypothetical protein
MAPANQSRPAQKIGILCLEVPPDCFAGSLTDPKVFDVPVLFETVRGAWVENMLNVDPGLTQPSIEAARRLEERGATLLLSNCGYFIAYKAAVETQVSIPVAISSLLWLPHLNAMRMPDRKIGVITFDSIKLTPQHLRAAWPSINFDAIAVAGLENTKTWEDASRKNSVYDFDQIWRDLSGTADRLLERAPNVQAILVECCTLCPFVGLLKEHTGLPVFDIVSLAKCWLSSLMSPVSAQKARPR